MPAQEQPKPREDPDPPKIEPLEFSVACDHSPDFKTNYKLVFKSNLNYADKEGQGWGFLSTITRGMPGSSKNNVITQSSDQTAQAMNFSNNVEVSRKMSENQ